MRPRSRQRANCSDQPTGRAAGFRLSQASKPKRTVKLARPMINQGEARTMLQSNDGIRSNQEVDVLPLGMNPMPTTIGTATNQAHLGNKGLSGTIAVLGETAIR